MRNSLTNAKEFMLTFLYRFYNPIEYTEILSVQFSYIGGMAKRLKNLRIFYVHLRPYT